MLEVKQIEFFESLNNTTPSDVYYPRDQQILKKRIQNELPRSKADGVSEIADTTVVPIGYGEFLCTLCLDSVHMP